MKTKMKSLFVLAFKKSRTLAAVLTLMLLSTLAYSQPTVPFTLVNRSNPAIADASIFVAVVGEKPAGTHVWIDLKTGAVKPMSVSDNTVTGPTINGNTGPGGNSKYANCFSRLSEIPNKIINIPGIAGCRILISFNQQLYLYFFGATGAPSGYAAPDANNPNDPNTGIKFENIELTNAANGLWVNTTRVDAYNYPMGLEVWGNSGFYQKVGELMTHAQITSQWTSTVPAAFAGCYDAANTIIHFPSKTAAFKAGGSQANYFQSYIDQIWSKYTGGDLVFNAGDAGVWRGRVSGTTFRFVRDGDGAVGLINGKPTTQDAMEAKGTLASGGQWDLVVQAQIAAAINRHAIDLNLAVGATQDFATPSKYYVTSPYNWYCKFWHRTDISYDSKTYSFAYDDVFNQSSTVNAGSPLRATISIGGFAGTVTNVPVTGVTVSPTSASIAAGATTQLTATVAPSNATNKTVSWSSSNSGVASVNSAGLVTGVAAGTATITVTTQDGSKTATSAITVSGTSTGVATFYKDCNYTGTAVALPLGTYTMSQLNAKGILNDDISSVKVNAGYKVTLYWDDNFTGTTKVLTADMACDATWNDKTTSVKVETNTAVFSTVIQAEAYTSMLGVQLETTTDAGGGQNVGWIDAGDWMAYNLTIPTAGTYRVIYRIASPNAAKTLRLEKDAGATQLGTVTVPNTGGWQTWSTVAHNVTLPAGTYAIGLATATGGFNLNYFTVTSNLSARMADETEVASEDSGVLILSPNPASSELYIGGVEKPIRAKVFNMQGQEVISVENPGNSISVQSLSQGLHFLVVERHNNTAIRGRFFKK
jgi:hypothetical protein